MTALALPFAREFVQAHKNTSIGPNHDYVAVSVRPADGRQIKSTLEYDPERPGAVWRYMRHDGVRDWFSAPPDFIDWPADPLRGGARTRTRMFATV